MVWFSATSILRRTLGIQPWVLGSLALLSVVINRSAIAQPILPATDGTGTIVTPSVNPSGNQFEITGGTQVGGNLFHSFQQFGLDTNQIATFLATPDLQNILGRITGGDPSVINGLLQVTGGSPNLYLINPAGIIFGNNASLNVPASFTATTATGIGFGTDNWFNAYGSNNYATLIGNPTSFLFNTAQPGSLVNAGVLTVSPGQSLNLIGGTTINTGTLTAPGGSITVLSVPGSSLIRLSQPGSLLSLEIEGRRTEDGGQNQNAPFPSSALALPSSPVSLPALLTGSGLTKQATGLVVEADGTVRLVATGTVIPTEGGTTIVAGTIDTSVGAGLAINSATTETGLAQNPPLPAIGGTVQILGDRVGLFAATIDATGDQGGGTVLVGGDYQGKGTLPTAQFTVMDGGTMIRADAVTSGNGGKVILWADQTTQFWGTISARGGAVSGNGGLVETSGKLGLQALGMVDSSAAVGNPGTWLLDPNNLTIQTAGQKFVTSGPNFTTTGDGATVTTDSIQAALNNGTSVVIATASAGANTQAGDITVANNISKTAGTDATLSLQAAGSIILNPNVKITSSAGKLNVVLTGDTDGNQDGAIVLNAGSSINSNNGNITLTGQGTATNTAGISLNNARLDAGAGNITLTGIGQDGTNNAYGIDLRNGATVSTTTGNITFTGNGSSGIFSNTGIRISDPGTRVSTTDGLIFMFGTGGPGSNRTNGGLFHANGAAITATGTGSINLQGTAGTGDDGNHGFAMDGAGTIVSTVSGDLSITGIGAGTGSNNYGINLVEGTISTNSGKMTLNGTSGVGTLNSFGVSINGTTLTTIDGNITLNGTGRGTDLTSTGIAHGGDILSTGNGNITLNGKGGGDDSGNYGVALGRVPSRIGSVNGAISITGTGGGSSTGAGDNRGIALFRETTIFSTGSGSIRLNGIGGQGRSQNFGVSLVGEGVNINAVDGAISISGKGQGSGSNNVGIIQTQGASVTSAGNAPITLQGEGASSTSNGIQTQAGNNRIGGETTNGSITLISNQMSLNDVTIRGNGALEIRPLTPGTEIGLGDGATGTLRLNNTQLNNLADGFRNITIGRSDSTSTLSLGNYSFKDPVTLTAATIQGSNQPTTWTITGSNSGFTGTTAFSGTNTILGGNGNDTFQFNPGVTFAGTLNGGGGTNTLQAGNTANLFTLTGINSGDLNGTAFTNIQTLQGGTGSNTVFFNGGTVPTIAGSTGNLTLIGDQISLSNISGTGSLTIQTATADRPIQLGGTPNPSVLDLTTNQLDTLQNGFSQITIGRASNPIVLAGNVTFRDPLVLQGRTIVGTGSITGIDNASLTLTASQALTVGDLTSSGQPIALTAPTIQTGNITTRSTTGGNLSLIAQTSVTTGSLDTSGTLGNGGNLFIDPSGDVQVTSINTQGGSNGFGGTIDITTGSLFRATGSFTDQTGTLASLSSTGGLGGGAITLRHGGGTITPFIVGDASLNGSQAAITSGSTTIAPRLEVPAGIYTQGNIQIITLGGVFDPSSFLNAEGSLAVQAIDQPEAVLGIRFAAVESAFTQEYAEHLETDVPQTKSLRDAIEVLRRVARKPGVKAALVYVYFISAQTSATDLSTIEPSRRDNDQLELMVITAEGSVIYRHVPAVIRAQVLAEAEAMRDEIAPEPDNAYERSSQQLYQWIIQPIDAALKERGIQHLVFITDAGLRSTPLAALQDQNERFLIEDYSVGIMPSFSLTNANYLNLQNATVLAMGAFQFQEQPKLPAVPKELDVVTRTLNQEGLAFLGTEFTLENLKTQHAKHGFPILHLATHSKFNPGDISQSYIQLSDRKLQLNQVKEMGWSNPIVDLLVLSACQTALGDYHAELGFGGSAFQTGARSVLGSLWSVQDGVTLAFMAEFYQQLKVSPTRAEALRRTQLAMLQGRISLGGGRLQTSSQLFDLPPELVKLSINRFSEPHYWSTFTLIGSPW